MTALPGITGVKRAVKAALAAPAFGAVLDALSAVYADDVSLPAPDADAIFLSERADLPSYPACEIVGDGSDPESGEDASVQDVGAYTHRLALVWTVLDDDEERVTATVERYLLATRRYLRGQGFEDTVLGGSALRPGREDYAPIGRRGDSGPFMKSGVLEVFVTTYE